MLSLFRVVVVVYFMKILCSFCNYCLHTALPKIMQSACVLCMRVLCNNVCCACVCCAWCAVHACAVHACAVHAVSLALAILCNRKAHAQNTHITLTCPRECVQGLNNCTATANAYITYIKYLHRNLPAESHYFCFGSVIIIDNHFGGRPKCIIRYMYSITTIFFCS